MVAGCESYSHTEVNPDLLSEINIYFTGLVMGYNYSGLEIG